MLSEKMNEEVYLQDLGKTGAHQVMLQQILALVEGQPK